MTVSPPIAASRIRIGFKAGVAIDWIATNGRIVPNPRVPARATVAAVANGMNGPKMRRYVATSAGFERDRTSAIGSAHTTVAMPASVATATAGTSATQTSGRRSPRRPCSRRRAMNRTIPVSAPSSVMLDRIVKTATAAKKTPAPRAPTIRVTTTASPNASTPDTT